MRSWSWISNADMHKRKAATGVGSWAFHLTDNEKLAFELSWLVGFSHHLVSW
jgi:hypothetical protein